MSSSTSDDERPPVKQPSLFDAIWGKLGCAFRPELLTWALGVTLAVDGSAAIHFAISDFQLATGPLGPAFAAILLAVGIANLVALYSLLSNVASWQMQSAVAQVLIAFTGLYVVATAQGLPLLRSGKCVVAVAVLLSAVAVAWVLRLVKTAGFQWSKTATLIVALFPLGGLVHFWFQSDYLPKMTDPLVDVATDLSPIGRADNIIRLSAKITVHNRGGAKLTEAGGLMRVTAYRKPDCPNPASTPQDVQGQLAFGTNTDSVFRACPTLPNDAFPLYAEGRAYQIGSGQTITVQREVDLDANKFRFARLSATLLFFTDRFIRHYELGPDAKTMRYRIAPLSAMKEIVAGDATLSVQLYTDPSADPESSAGHEYPRLDYTWCTVEVEENSCPGEQAVSTAYPIVFVQQWAEYAPTDHEPNQK